MSEKIRFVSDGAAIISMRESDFDAYSAYGEVIDNSMQANAKQIKIQLVNEKSSGRGPSYYIIKELAFGDDGTGMGSDVLNRCLQLGYSSRYNDRSGIGRFGVGMTLAAINQCRRVEVFSKQTDGDWLWTYMDLDELSSDPPAIDAIPMPKKKKPPANYKNLVGADSGTLVVWSKYDRQPESADKVLEEMKIWCGRTYRYFIWEGTELFINGEGVYAIDPLYSTTKDTKFPEDPSAHEFKAIKIPFPVPQSDQQSSKKKKSDIKIRISLIDESLRPNSGAGGSNAARDRCIDRNQGVSILRNNREVFYGPIPYWPGDSKWFNEKDRYWGCEISFDAVLDRAFTVKNIKRGAVPNRELKKIIYEKIKGTRDTCLERISDCWRKAKQAKEEKERNEKGVLTGHEQSESVAKKTSTDKSQLGKNVDFDDAAKRLVDKIAEDQTELEKTKMVAKWKDQPFTIHDGNWKGPLFMEITHMGGADVIQYNRSHSFFEAVYRIMDELSEEEGNFTQANDLKCLIDLLLIAYAKAEAKFEPNTQYTSEEYAELLGSSWGMYLRSYLKTWLNQE